jgi:hypothetical protein
MMTAADYDDFLARLRFSFSSLTYSTTPETGPASIFR